MLFPSDRERNAFCMLRDDVKDSREIGALVRYSVHSQHLMTAMREPRDGLSMIHRSIAWVDHECDHVVTAPNAGSNGAGVAHARSIVACGRPRLISIS